MIRQRFLFRLQSSVTSQQSLSRTSTRPRHNLSRPSIMEIVARFKFSRIQSQQNPFSIRRSVGQPRQTRSRRTRRRTHFPGQHKQGRNRSNPRQGAPKFEIYSPNTTNKPLDRAHSHQIVDTLSLSHLVSVVSPPVLRS